MNTASHLNAFLRRCESARHCRPDVFEHLVDSFVQPNSWLLNRSNFGPRPHSFLYEHPVCSSTTKSHQLQTEKDLGRISHVRPDVQEHLLLCLFSSVTHHTPSLNLGPSPRPFLKLMKKHKKPTTLTPTVTKANIVSSSAKQAKTMSTNALRAFALHEKILFSRKSTPQFTSLFPSTSLPRITFVLGTPRIDRELFNKLLTSRLRALKSTLKLNGHKCPKALPKDLVLEFSRMIDRSLSQELESRKKDKKSAQQKKATVTKKPTKDLSSRFVSSTLPADLPGPSAIETTDKEPRSEDETSSQSSSSTSSPPPREVFDPWAEFVNTGPNAIQYASPSDLDQMYELHRQLLPPAIFSTGHPSLRPAALTLLRQLGLSFAVKVSDPSVNPMRWMTSWNTLMRDGRLRDPDHHSELELYPLPPRNFLENELTSFYRDPAIFTERLQALADYFEVFVMTLRSA